MPKLQLAGLNFKTRPKGRQKLIFGHQYFHCNAHFTGKFLANICSFTKKFPVCGQLKAISMLVFFRCTFKNFYTTHLKYCVNETSKFLERNCVRLRPNASCHEAKKIADASSYVPFHDWIPKIILLPWIWLQKAVLSVLQACYSRNFHLEPTLLKSLMLLWFFLYMGV